MAKVAKAVVGGILAVAGVAFGQPYLTKLGYTLIISNALDVVAQSLADKPRTRRLGIEIEYQGTVEPRRLIYGKQKVSGMNCIPPWTSGDRNQYLHQVLVLCGHQAQDIETVYFNKDEITAIGSVTGTKDDGKVSSGTYAGKAWIRRYRGTSTQTVDFILNSTFPSQWDSNHKGAGNAYLALMYEQDDEVYQNGKPEITCIVLGRRVYDPRLDPDPGENVTNSAYRAYSTNPALCAADYLLLYLRGRGLDKSRIDWDSVSAAANVCDEDCAIPGSTTQKRYTCNVTLDMAETDQADRENLKTLIGAMMGHAVYRAGKWRLHAGAASDPTFTLIDHDVRGKWSLRTETPADETYNYVRGQFVDSARDYQLSEFEARSDAAYETADGGRFQREVVFPCCDSNYEAQRNAIITLKRSRLRMQLTAIFSLAAFKIRPWDVGTITFTPCGWDEQLVRCIAWALNENGTVTATFMEEDDAVWDDPESSDYLVPAIGGTVPGGPRIPDAPSTLNVISRPDGVLVRPAYSSGWLPTDRFRVYMHTSATPFSSAVVVDAQASSDRIFIPLTTTDTYFFWVTVVGRFGQTESNPTPTGAGAPGKASSITSGFRLLIDRASHLKKLVGTGTGTTDNTSTVTPVEDVGAPTYAWAYVSGSTKIEPVAPTAATTGFRIKSGQTVADGATESAVFECTGTSAGASPGTATEKTTVTFLRNDNLYN